MRRLVSGSIRWWLAARIGPELVALGLIIVLGIVAFLILGVAS
jgi:hypothetical protein